jgi:light-regulated signal transduction histidine kinase (bacteriophytochrome)
MASVLSLVSDNTAQVKADEELKRSNDELQQFAYVASHDLQEPVRMVINYLSLLERRNKDRLDPKSVEYLNFALDGGVRMRQLISDLLLYSRIDTQGKEIAPVNMQEVVSKTLILLKVPIEESKADVIVNPLPIIMADESQMMQVMQNLISNALKFHGLERPLIRVSSTQGAKEWTFAVKDNGIGLNMRYADKIFQMFQRLHTGSEYPGTGVGLAVAKKIIDRHGGRIWVESEEGKGATFFFTIPIQIKSNSIDSQSPNSLHLPSPR